MQPHWFSSGSFPNMHRNNKIKWRRTPAGIFSCQTGRLPFPLNGWIKPFARLFPGCSLTSSPLPLTATHEISVRVNKAIYWAPFPSPSFCLGFDLASSLFKVLRLSLSTLPVLAGAFPCSSCARRALLKLGCDGQGQWILAGGSMTPTVVAGMCHVRATHCSGSAKGFLLQHTKKKYFTNPIFRFCY